MRVALAELEELVDSPECKARLTELEEVLPSGGRHRQLPARSLLLGVLLTQADDRPAHLTRVLDALCALPLQDRLRLGVVERQRRGDHELTYRQVEHLMGRVRKALGKESPDGTPSEELSLLVDALLEASIPERYKLSSPDFALDWSDHASFGLPTKEGEPPGSDREASWGHRRGTAPGEDDGLFFGYYASFATMVRTERGDEVPELIRRMQLATCAKDPVVAFLPVLERLVARAVALGDVLTDSGYSYRKPEHWARPMRLLGASLIEDLHPSDRGPKGTHAGAIICNGRLYCPGVPRALLDLGPLRRGASKEEVAAHDRLCSELARYELGRVSKDDDDGYHRVMCPATAGKLRCPLKESSLALPFDRPEVLDTPEHPPPCCTQVTITVPPYVGEKARQKHPYPGPAWRASYARRSSAERSHGSTKDRSHLDTSRGWCRLMGLTANSLFLSCSVVVRNIRIVAAFEARAADDAAREALGRPLRRRRRRRAGREQRAETAVASGSDDPDHTPEEERAAALSSLTQSPDARLVDPSRSNDTGAIGPSPEQRDDRACPPVQHGLTEPPRDDHVIAAPSEPRAPP